MKERLKVTPRSIHSGNQYLNKIPGILCLEEN